MDHNHSMGRRLYVRHIYGRSNGMVYAALPLAAGIASRVTSPLRGLLGKEPVKKRLNNLVQRLFTGGPDETARAEERTEFWGEAIGPDGERVAMHFSAPNVYSLTVDAVVRIALRCHRNANGAAGYFTASMLMGADFIEELDGVSAIDDVTTDS